MMTKKSAETPDFEVTLTELEKLVASLEEGEQSLDDSLTGFKRGIELTRLCQNMLDNAQQTVDQLMDTEDQDSIAPFKPDA